MSANNSIKEQLRRNTVALISLAVAVVSLSYNTWRNEKSEGNRTQRVVAVESLIKLGELQQIVYHHYWDKDFDDRGNLRTGWTLVLSIRDITSILDDPLPEASETFLETWDNNSSDLAHSKEAKDAIENGINSLRNDLLAMLAALD